ncbi:MAG: DUF1653 domain-containing protein [Lachnospiraceae bacterium]|jgi:hypothetical protein|nr:DUF1653 domain-containing protein [Lachnospiraceae bacterium]
MRETPREFEIYRHFKGDNYQIVTTAIHSETGEELVIYKALYGEGKTYARPLDMFLSEVDREKYPNADQKYRFEKQEMAADPGVMEFLAAETAEERIKILNKMELRITDSMIDTMAMSLDIDVKQGPVSERFDDLKGCLETIKRFETNRLR